MSSTDATIIMRLPPDLKDLYQALCKSRGVTVSDSLRTFMADEINRAIELPDTPTRKPRPKKATKAQNKDSKAQQAKSDAVNAFNKTLKR